MKHQQWIHSPVEKKGAAISFCKSFSLDRALTSATVRMTGLGVYQACINGEKIGRQVLAPGWTSYAHRVQYETADLTDCLKADNEFVITVAPGWAVGRIGYQGDQGLYAPNVCAVVEIELNFADGTTQWIATDESWEVYTNEVTFSDIYDGETVDKTVVPTLLGNACLQEKGFPLVEQVGADICEQDQLAPIELITTPKGERVIDFGQNMTGYVSLKIQAKRGDRIVLDFGEVLDSEGNFYNENYRSAKNLVTYICSGNEDFFKPAYSFQGFRYVRLNEYPFETVDLDAFRAIVVHSDIIWGQKSNYLDIPTDCPQRDERLGWTGDTQVFCRVGAMNFDTRKFFKKWLGDLRLEQGEDGSVRGVCPENFGGTYRTRIATGWGDVCTIVPWTMYEIYNDPSFLSENFEMMKKWVGYMRSAGDEEYLWLSGCHYGDWLAMDAGEDSYVGATSNDLIASAFFANSVDLVIRAGEVLGEDVSEYRELYKNVVKTFRSYFMENGMPKEEFPLTEIPRPGKAPSDSVRKGMTQTALVLILHFNLCLPEEREALANKLVELIEAWGNKMTTGFLGTPYILHVLSECGKQDVAYKLFFQEENPSWLYSVNHGATTMWEHWNGIKEDGTFWSTAMNSFNHYAYGAVGDWMYGEICGVKILEGGVGYKKFRIAPKPCERLGFARCALDTVAGRIKSAWYYSGERICFEFTVPKGSEAVITLPNGFSETVTGGSYCYSIQK